MARPHRPQVAGGIYHVYARGNRRADIYLDDLDRELYLRLLGRVVERRLWRCLAYCLMRNHVHLLVETPDPNIGDGMRLLHGVYAQTFNARHGEVGHVFQGRYGSTLITTDEQFLMAVGYIAHNPVEAGLVGDPAAWAWSSHAATAGRRPRPAWLDVARLLALLGGWGGDPRDVYRGVVAARGRGVTLSTSLVNVGGSGPPTAPIASTVRNR